VNKGQTIPATPKRVGVLTALISFFTLVLMGMTGPLWQPQTLFPQVPLVSMAIGWPTWVGWGALGGMVASVAVLLWLSQIGQQVYSQAWRQAASLALFGSYVLLVVINQQRLQPWAYQFVVGLLILSCLSAERAIQWFRLLVISIYFYSALSKFDLTFLQTLGQQLLDGLLQAMHIAGDGWSWNTRLILVAMFPLVELLTACGLACHKTRQAALLLSLSLHTLLLLALGPLGLDHHRGVLGWNVYFMIQNIILFRPPKEFHELTHHTEGAEQKWMTVSWLIKSGSTLVLVAPCLGWIGYFDHWPSWGLYAAHHDRLTLFVAEAEIHRLPASIRPFIDAPQTPHRWCRVRMDRWSLETLKAPLYPQSRFHLGVAIGLGKELQQIAPDLNPDAAIKVILEDGAHRLTGKRHSQECIGLAEVESLADKYWLNVWPVFR
jgi:hypothetical protein